MRRCIAVIALRTAIAAADPSPMSSGAIPAPTTETQVAMTAETLAIRVGLREAAVRAEITLANRGPATSLVVGFPCATGDKAGRIDVPCAVPLAVTVGGKRVRAALRKAATGPSHQVWTMALAEAAQVELVVAYRAPLINPNYRVPAFGMGLFT
jgi:hypothetical protein